MEVQLNNDKLKAMAKELAKDMKTDADLSEVMRQLTKLTIETALDAEMDEHLGYVKHDPAGNGSGNSRNGSSRKSVIGDNGPVDIEVPRDREGDFDPVFVRKGQRRVTGMDEKILALYARGQSTRDIVESFKELYDADISATLVSKVTDRVIEQVNEWQARPLDPLYPILYLDGIVMKIRKNQRVENKTMYVALAVNLRGEKELLGLWLSDSEGAKFWLSVITDLKNRGMEDVLIACVDGLKGFPEAINTEFPQTQIQLCIVHQVRNSLRFVSWKHYKAVTRDLKAIYQAPTEQQALVELDRFNDTWGEQFPQVGKSWENNWVHLRTLFDYPPEIRKAIYTTNAIESLNSVIRKATRNRKVFPTDQSAMKVSFLAILNASKNWKRPIHNWKEALNRFSIQFEDRVTPYL
jgi:transposase-like protein